MRTPLLALALSAVLAPFASSVASACAMPYERMLVAEPRAKPAPSNLEQVFADIDAVVVPVAVADVPAVVVTQTQSAARIATPKPIPTAAQSRNAPRTANASVIAEVSASGS